MTNKEARYPYPSVGLMLYRRNIAKGEEVVYPSPRGNPGISPNVTMLTAGKLRTYNTNREGYLDIEGRLGQIYGGFLLPGTYTLVGLEDSVYICLAFTNSAPVTTTKGEIMFELQDHKILKFDAKTFQAPAYRAVICMHGTLRNETTGQVLKEGDVCYLEGTESVTLIAQEDSVVGAHFNKEA